MGPLEPVIRHVALLLGRIESSRCHAWSSLFHFVGAEGDGSKTDGIISTAVRALFSGRMIRAALLLFI